MLSQLGVLMIAVAAWELSLFILCELAPQFSGQEAMLRQWFARGKLIAVKKRGSRLLSHPKLLGEA